MSGTPITSQGHVQKETVTVIVSVGGFYQDNHQFLFKHIIVLLLFISIFIMKSCHTSLTLRETHQSLRIIIIIHFHNYFFLWYITH